MEDEFVKMDIIHHNQPNPDNKITYERFSAIKHEIRDVGRGQSHIGILKLAKERNYSTIIIFEDDFSFTVTKHELYKQLGYLNGVYMDACILAGNYTAYNRSNMTPNLYRLFNAQTTTGYLINCRYNDTLINCYQTAVENLERTNNHLLYTIDVAWNQLQATDPWYTLKTMIGQKRLVCSDTFCNI
jgi:GR25 family glycosyltransferase involved in LPS biosynthesis